MEFLKALRQVVQEPLWGFLIVLAALGVLGLASLLLYSRRQVLAYSVFRRSLAEEGRIFRDGPRISLDGREVSDVDIVVVRLANAGGAPIRVKDRAFPVGLEFGESARILGSRVLIPDVSSADASIIVEDPGRLELRALLLDEGATVEIEVALARCEKVEVSGSIGEAGRMLNVRGREPPDFRRWMRAFLMLEGAGLLMVVAGRISDPDNYPYPPTLLAVAGAVAMCAGALSLLLWLAMTAWMDRGLDRT